MGVQRARRRCPISTVAGVQSKTTQLFNLADASVQFQATYSAVMRQAFSPENVQTPGARFIAPFLCPAQQSH